MQKRKGFTLIELVMIFSAISLMVYSYVTFIANIQGAALDSATRKIQSDLRWTHQQSIATGKTLGAKFSSVDSTYIIFENDESTPVINPTTTEPWIENLSAFPHVSIDNDYKVVFNSFGQPTEGGDGQLRLITSEGDIRDIYVVAESGLVVIDLIGAGSGCGCEVCLRNQAKD